MARHHIDTEIDIDAAPAKVWQILTDFASYPQWNPFVRQIRGEPQVGEQIEARIQPSGGKAMTFRPRIVAAEPERELRWLGRLLWPGLFDGEHRFAIHPLSDAKYVFGMVSSSAASSCRCCGGASTAPRHAGFTR